MTTMPISEPQTAAAPVTVRRVLVATDGREADAGAIRAAELLARERGADVSVLSVLRSRRVDESGTWFPTASGRAWRRAQRVRRRIEEALGAPRPWPVRASAGAPGVAIARFAEEEDVDLIVTGLGRHDLVHRLLGPEVTVGVARLLTVPMLAVPASLERLPRAAVLGVDVGHSCAWAGRMALAVMGERATLHLAHVRASAAGTFDAFVEQTFDQVERAIAPPPTVIRHRALLHGEPAEALLGHAAVVGAELVALGTNERTRRSHLALGSTAAAVLRQSTCAVLL
jgi:nucleotide-binding universal stress UspA family protein